MHGIKVCLQSEACISWLNSRWPQGSHEVTSYIKVGSVLVRVYPCHSYTPTAREIDKIYGVYLVLVNNSCHCNCSL